MPIRAYLYDALGQDKEVSLTTQVLTDLNEKQLLWVDVHSYDESELRQLVSPLGLKRDSLYTLLQTEHRPRLDNYGAYSQFNIHTLQEAEGKYTLVEVDFILRPNLIVTLHRAPVEFLNSFDRRVKGDSNLG